MMSIFSRNSFPVLAILLGVGLLFQPLYRLGQLLLVLPFFSLRNILDNPPHIKLLIKSFATQGVLLLLLGFILSSLFVLYFTNRDRMTQKVILSILVVLGFGECGLFFSSPITLYDYRHIDYHVPLARGGQLSISLSFSQFEPALLNYLLEAKTGAIDCFIRPNILAFPSASPITIEGIGVIPNNTPCRLTSHVIDRLIHEKRLHLRVSVQVKDSLIVRDIKGSPLQTRQDTIMLDSDPLLFPKDQSMLVYFMFMTHDSKPLAVFF